MGRVIKIGAWGVGVILSLVFLFATLAFLAVRYNVWPSRCEWLPSSQARNVCAFSKRNSVKTGTPTSLHFWVTSAFSNPVFLVLNGGELLPMERQSDNNFTLSLPVTVGRMYSYAYKQEGVSSTSTNHSYLVRSLDPSIVEVVETENDAKNILRASESMRRVVDTAPVWSINYNYNYFENTRTNIDNIMSRARALRANELGVHTFIEAKGNEDVVTLAPIESPLKYLGNASITASDMKTLVKRGKKYGLDIVLHYEITPEFIQYYNVRNTDTTTVGYGRFTAIEKAMNDLGFSNQKSIEWVDMWFDALEPVLITWAEEAEEAGIYGIDITPEQFSPRFAPYEKRADARYKSLIKKIRKVYTGKIFSSSGDSFGGIHNSNNITYVHDTDGLYLEIPRPASVYLESSSMIRDAYEIIISNLIRAYASDMSHIILELNVPARNDTARTSETFDMYDFADADNKGLVVDVERQANEYEAILQILSKGSWFSGVSTKGYWFDDVVNPAYADPLITMTSSIRNTPAEAVWKKWIGEK